MAEVAEASAKRAADLTRQLLAVQPAAGDAAAQVLDLNDIVSEPGEACCGACIGEDIAAATVTCIRRP